MWGGLGRPVARRRPTAGHGVGEHRQTVRAQLVDVWVLTGSVSSGAAPSPGALVASTADLRLQGADGTALRHWLWTEVDGWDADGVAPDGDGRLRQVLAFRVRHGVLAVLVDAGQLGRFLPELTTAFEAQRRRAAKVRRRQSFPARRIAAATACVALLGGVAGVVPSLLAQGAPAGQRGHPTSGTLEKAFGARPIHLAKATSAPAPAPTSLATSPLAPHEAFGFLPYWVLPDPSEIDLSSLTTVAYFSVDVTAAGTVDESPSNSGWVGYESRALADVITQAHDAGERVVLSATCFDQSALDVLTHDPAAQATLAATLVTLVRAKNLDGVNLDFEGTGATDRTGLDELVATVSQTLHAADPAWQFTADTYASSAADAGGFYDVTGMAPFLDAFVVMAYDMGDTFAAGPTDPLTGSGFTDQDMVSSYTAAAGAAKVIFGMPLYGEDWPTTGPTAGDPATGPPTPVADDQIAATDTVYWDPTTDGPWAVYRVGGQWHQVWFDDPASLATKARLASAAGLRGEALWALGMAAGTDDQAAAFTGVALEPQPPDGTITVWRGPAPRRLPSGAGTEPGSSGRAGLGSAPPAGAFGAAGAPGGSATVPSASGVFGGVDVSLVPWPGASPSATMPAGTLGTFSAPGTSVACLTEGPPLPVVQIDGTSAYLVRATTPADCAGGVWAFVIPAAGSSSSSGSASGPSGASGTGGGLTNGSPSGAGPSGSGNGEGTGTVGGTTPSTVANTSST